MRNRVISRTRKAYRRSAILMAVRATLLIAVAVILGAIAIALTTIFWIIPGIILAVISYWLVVLALLDYNHAFTLWQWQ